MICIYGRTWSFAKEGGALLRAERFLASAGGDHPPVGVDFFGISKSVPKSSHCCFCFCRSWPAGCLGFDHRVSGSWCNLSDAVARFRPLFSSFSCDRRMDTGHDSFRSGSQGAACACRFSAGFLRIVFEYIVIFRNELVLELELKH